jgi:SAM-dependent methyltransferase
MSITYHSETVRRETLHTVSLVAPHLATGSAVLDIGCGSGYVARELAQRGHAVQGVDIVDVRRVDTGPFALFDGVMLPFEDGRFDMVMLNFVLHHVPDEKKIALLRQAMRVSRGGLFVLEDTPETLFDRMVSHQHGRAYRRKISSDAPFGFLTFEEWRWLFRGLGLSLIEARPLGRLCRSIAQPFARSVFVLGQPARKGEVVPLPRISVSACAG